MRLQFGDFEFDRDARRLTRAGRPVTLSGEPLEFLVMLLEKPGIVVTREQIRRRIWPHSRGDLDQKLIATEDAVKSAFGGRRFIEAIPNLGYRFVGSSMVRPAPARVKRWSFARVAIYLILAAAVAAIAWTVW